MISVDSITRRARAEKVNVATMFGFVLRTHNILITLIMHVIKGYVTRNVIPSCLFRIYQHIILIQFISVPF